MKRHIPVQIEWHPDPAQAVPVYRQILEWMYGKMESGEWPAGTRLPSQREMARHFQVNRSTLNQALKPLLEAGVLLPLPPWAMSSRWGCPPCVRLWLGMPESGIQSWRRRPS